MQRLHPEKVPLGNNTQVVSLRYDEQIDEAPRVDIVANGIAEVEEILQLAKHYNIPVIEDRELALALSTCEEETEIPSNLYRAVAIVLQQLRSLLG